MEEILTEKSETMTSPSSETRKTREPACRAEENLDRIYPYRPEHHGYGPAREIRIDLNLMFRQIVHRNQVRSPTSSGES